MRKKSPSLLIAPSKIPKAGLGLFARRDFSKGERICYIKGKVIPNKVIERKKDWGERGKYFIELGENTLDVYDTHSFGRYANDAEGFTKIKGLKNNSEFCQCRNGKMVYVAATKDIKAGQEIFIHYGIEYWDSLK